MPAPRVSPLGRFLSGFVHAGRGLGLAASQRNFKVHLAAAATVIALAAWLRVGALEWVILLICIFWVLGMEAINTAVELLADRVCLERDPLIGRVKDVAAAAVLLSALGAAAVGLILFLPHLAQHL